MGGGGWFDVFENQELSLEAQRGWPGPAAAAIFPPRPPSAGPPASQPCQRAMLSRWLVVSLRTGCLTEREKRGEREACPQDSEGSHSEALWASGGRPAGLHTAEAPGPRRGGEQVSEVVCVRPLKSRPVQPHRGSLPGASAQ